jgi:hypothetical protein
MKFDKIKELLNVSSNEIKKAIQKIKPIDLKRKLKYKQDGENLIIKLIRSKLS